VIARPPVLLAATIIAWGCHAASDDVRADVRAYLQRMSGWAPIQAETARTLERILATEFVDEAEVGHQIADSRPRVVAHLQQVRAYVPRTDPVRRIHEAYIQAWERLLTGYDALEKGFATGEYSNLARGREAMTAWRDGMVGVARDLSELARRLGVDLEGAAETSASPASSYAAVQGMTSQRLTGASVCYVCWRVARAAHARRARSTTR
jgi:hypothetical protein